MQLQKRVRLASFCQKVKRASQFSHYITKSRASVTPYSSSKCCGMTNLLFLQIEVCKMFGMLIALRASYMSPRLLAKEINCLSNREVALKGGCGNESGKFGQNFQFFNLIFCAIPRPSFTS